MIDLVICDDQEVVCQGLKAILSTAENLRVVGIANNGMEALDLIEKHMPHVALMDLKMPVMNGIHTTKAIKEKYPDTKVLILTTYDSSQIKNAALNLNMVTLRQDGIQKVLRGISTIEEIIRVTQQ